MQLITGGLGFVGANTAQALLDLDADCVLTQHRKVQVPEFLKEQVGKRIFIESADTHDLDSLRALGKKHKITGIIHLVTGGVPAGRANALELVEDIHNTVNSIANVIQVAHEWGVKRVTLTSAPVIYNGITQLPWREAQPLPMTADYPMEAAKKCGESFPVTLAPKCMLSASKCGSLLCTVQTMTQQEDWSSGDWCMRQ